MRTIRLIYALKGDEHVAPACRDCRFHFDDRGPDQRNPFQRDRDRILYTSAFRRLGWVTQVVSSWEGEPFHNRLTHTLEVAQIGRRLAEKLIAEQPKEAKALGGLDPDVVEAAALAHDLGHPPFGHTAEKELNRLMVEAGVEDGFEGNAQSFRVVTKLAVRQHGHGGLNLCRATLDAILKYPWHRGPQPPLHLRKWGAYGSESEELEWVRGPEPRDTRKCAEAELMDFADDVAYAVHDVEDFYRAGLIPLDKLVRHEEEVDKFLDGAFASLKRNGQEIPYGQQDCRTAFTELLDTLSVREPYEGKRAQRADLRSMTAGLINRYVGAIKLQVSTGPTEPYVKITEEALKEIFIFKQLTWRYVIENIALASQQYGQQQIMAKLFTIFKQAVDTKQLDIFPASYRDMLEDLRLTGRYDRGKEPLRIVADLLAGLTEQQAVGMYQRLTGMSLGTVMNSIVR